VKAGTWAGFSVALHVRLHLLPNDVVNLGSAIAPGNDCQLVVLPTTEDDLADNDLLFEVDLFQYFAAVVAEHVAGVVEVVLLKHDLLHVYHVLRKVDLVQGYLR